MGQGAASPGTSAHDCKIPRRSEVDPVSEASLDERTELEARHRLKAARIKAAKDRLYASKTVEKGLLIVHTGTGKGKSTAAWGLAMRSLGHGLKLGIVQFVKGGARLASARSSRVSPISSPCRSWARASPGKRKIGPATSPRPTRPGPKPSR